MSLPRRPRWSATGPATDVAMGQLIGATGILVLSGATSAAEAAAHEVRPDHTLGSIRDLIP